MKNNPYGMEVVSVNSQWDLIMELSKIRREHYQLALGMSQIGSYWCRLSNAWEWVAFSSFEKEENYSVVQLCLMVLEKALRQMNRAMSSVSIQTEFWVEPEAERVVDRFLEESGWVGERPLIAIHCGGRHFIRKRWPMEYFIQLVQALESGLGWRIMVIGGVEDLEIALALLARTNAMSSVGRLTLAQTAVLLQKCQLMIGNDSGPLHLAAALDVKTLGLFGPTAPRQFYPYSGPDHRFIYKHYPCSPCYRFGGSLLQYVPRCSKPYCMEAISVAEVVQVAQELVLGAPVRQRCRERERDCGKSG